MQFNINRYWVRIMEILERSPALRRFFYVLAALWWSVAMVAAVRWW